MARVLVLYGTLEGQTAKISEYIAEVAKDLGYNAEAVNIAELPSGFPLEEYEAVIVGASVHMKKHEDYVRDFVKNNRESLERIPSAFFSVSLTAVEKTEEARSQIGEVIEGFIEETGWHPNRLGIFAGALAYTRYGFVKRYFMKRIVKEKRPVDIDTSRDYEYTNWEDVRRFSEDFLEVLSGDQGRSS